MIVCDEDTKAFRRVCDGVFGRESWVGVGLEGWRCPIRPATTSSDVEYTEQGLEVNKINKVIEEPRNQRRSRTDSRVPFVYNVPIFVGHGYTGSGRVLFVWWPTRLGTCDVQSPTHPASSFFVFFFYEAGHLNYSGTG